MTVSLSDPTLLKSQALVGGAWVDADGGATLDVLNPATGELIGTVPDMGADETRRAIDAAAEAQTDWAKRTAKERAGVLRKWFDLMMANQDDLGRLMTAEQGKPVAEAKGEIAYAASFIEWFAEEAKRVYGDTIPSPAPDKRLFVIKQPVGVVGAITPWNFPTAMITRKAAPALAAGCSFVVKPAEDTPLSALAAAELALRAGLPKGLLSIITGSKTSAEAIGGELCGNPTVRKISFTGSTAVGKILLKQSADTVKRASMELGGNAPFIVFDDADVDRAVKGLMASKYRNTGQVCVAANRIYVQDGIYDAFAAKLAEASQALRIGDGLKGETDIGPLINKAGLEKVERLVEGAKEKGARTLTGGARHELGGTFYQATVMTDVTTEMDIAHEEIFGPVAALQRFKTDEEAIELANATEYGLAAYFYAGQVARCWRIAEAIEAGMVGINEGVMSNEVAPFGGVKQSGLGREGSKYGIEEFVEIKYICLGGV